VEGYFKVAPYRFSPCQNPCLVYSHYSGTLNDRRVWQTVSYYKSSKILC